MAIKKIPAKKIPIKKIFVCEFVTAGGFNHLDLPAGLVAEATLMRDALLRDLSTLPYEISTTIDARLSAPEYCDDCLTIDANQDVWDIWASQVQLADAVWLIAPETDGLLQKLTALAVQKGKLVLGSGADAIQITSEKLATYNLLQQAGIATIPTYTVENWPKTAGRWLVKPNDGAGCDGIVIFDDADNLTNWLAQNNKSPRYVIQPYRQGIPASISCVMHQGRAQVLSCNTQMIISEKNGLTYAGSQVNGMQHLWHVFELIAQKITETLADLNGYVGIDVLVNELIVDTQNENLITVVEINPRLTTSYAVLADAIATNPAELIINTFTQPNFVWPALKRHVVSVHV
ncbi:MULTISPECIES: ATP-grasp domain-containing protein [Methylotenera]|uniref:ATP-grasp domain-containing protein n=1 Tax=Methylotenera TaxID=359407 RepID=UPI0003648EC2|nr:MULTISPECIES: ATP-grasp domain-containing protein [Methylotenera]